MGIVKELLNPKYNNLNEWKDALPSLPREELQDQWNSLRWGVDTGRPMIKYSAGALVFATGLWLVEALRTQDSRAIVCAGITAFAFYLLAKGNQIQTQSYMNMLKDVEQVMTGVKLT